ACGGRADREARLDDAVPPGDLPRPPGVPCPATGLRGLHAGFDVPVVRDRPDRSACGGEAVGGGARGGGGRPRGCRGVIRRAVASFAAAGLVLAAAACGGSPSGGSVGAGTCLGAATEPAAPFPPATDPGPMDLSVGSEPLAGSGAPTSSGAP